MIKKALLVLALVMQLAAVAPVAQADIELPTCFPCGGK
jgi:hypothetical protein